MSKSNDMSLVSLIKDNPDYIDRIQELAVEVKKDKSKILSMASKYNNKYEKQISEGTKKRQLLLAERVNHGQSPEEAERSLGFIPSIYTPILNWLYFFMMEEQIPEKELLRSEQEEQYRHLLHENVNVKGMDNVPDVFVVLSGKNISYENFKTLKKLKQLATKNDSINESIQAYKKCLQLCEKFDIDFNKIPV